MKIYCSLSRSFFFTNQVTREYNIILKYFIYSLYFILISAHTTNAIEKPTDNARKTDL